MSVGYAYVINYGMMFDCGPKLEYMAIKKIKVSLSNVFHCKFIIDIYNKVLDYRIYFLIKFFFLHTF